MQGPAVRSTPFFVCVLWSIVPMLSGDSLTVTSSGQRLVKHIPAAMNMYAITELLLQMGCFYVVCAELL
jgi:hypothetical protein